MFGYLRAIVVFHFDIPVDHEWSVFDYFNDLLVLYDISRGGGGVLQLVRECAGGTLIDLTFDPIR